MQWRSTSTGYRRLKTDIYTLLEHCLQAVRILFKNKNVKLFVFFCLCSAWGREVFCFTANIVRISKLNFHRNLIIIYTAVQHGISHNKSMCKRISVILFDFFANLEIVGCQGIFGATLPFIRCFHIILFSFRSFFWQSSVCLRYIVRLLINICYFCSAIVCLFVCIIHK